MYYSDWLCDFEKILMFYYTRMYQMNVLSIEFRNWVLNDFVLKKNW